MRRILTGLALAAIALLAAGYFLLRAPSTSYEALDAVYASPASKFLDMGGGVSAHYRDEGNPSGRTLLLVHGFSASLHTWEKWVPLLGGEYRMVSVDLPGHGLTRTPAGYAPSQDGYAEFLDTFAQKLNLGKVTVIGSSMGGGAAWRLALSHPERVEGLVLVGASGWLEPRTGKEPAIFAMLRNPVMGPILRRMDNTAQVRDGLKTTFVNQALVDDAMVKRYVDFSRLPNHGDVLIALMTSRDQRSVATKEMLAKISAPTLILHGREDHLVNVSGAEKFHDAIAGSKAVIYDNVGHLPQEEIPERSADDLRAFLHAAFPEPAAGAPLAAAMPGR